MGSGCLSGRSRYRRHLVDDERQYIQYGGHRYHHGGGEPCAGDTDSNHVAGRNDNAVSLVPPTE